MSADMTTPTTELTGAALLREAARVMRERAVDADVGDWYDNDELLGRLDTEEDANFAASMTPTVALAVADWLDDEAAWQGRPSGPVRLSEHNPALVVARAYLGLS